MKQKTDLEFINENIEGLKKQANLSLEKADANSYNRWLRSLTEAMTVREKIEEKENAYETDKKNMKTLEEVKKKVEENLYYYKCDTLKRKPEDFKTDFMKILNNEDRFLLDVSEYPRGCGKTTLLKEFIEDSNNSEICVLVKSSNPEYRSYRHLPQKDNHIKNKKIKFIYMDLNNFRGLSIHKKYVCEEGFSIYEILKMKYEFGLNIQCALISGVN